MGANEAIGATDTSYNSQRTGQVDYIDSLKQYAENQQLTQQQTRRPNSIWVEGGAFIT